MCYTNPCLLYFTLLIQSNEYQLPQPSVDSVQNVVTAVPVTVPPPATVTPPVAAGTMDPQPDTDITMVVTAPTGGGLADVHCSTNI